MADAYDARGVSKTFMPNIPVNPRFTLDRNLIILLNLMQEGFCIVDYSEIC